MKEIKYIILYLVPVPEPKLITVPEPELDIKLCVWFPSLKIFFIHILS